MTEFKEGQRVRRKSDWSGSPTGVIRSIVDNMAVVGYSHYQDNRFIKLTDLVSAEPPKEEPFKPGWYKIKHRPANNFIYYVQSVSGHGASLVYTMAYNPQTGEMDANFNNVSVLIPKVLLQSPRDLVRLKFVEE